VSTQYTKFSGRASLAGIGFWMRYVKIWAVVEEQVEIKQKTMHHTPLDKLLDALINILGGGQGMCEVNTRVKPDKGLQQAFGRTDCADQSTISTTLNRCTSETVSQLRAALNQIYQTYSQGYGHNYEVSYQLLDVDMTGMPAGRQGEGVSKGYFAGQKNKRGRQLGRVIASHYDEIVVDRLYDGKRQLDRSLQELVRTAEKVLDLRVKQRRQTVLRVDAGGGRDADVNWMLKRGYQVLVKVKNHWRAAKLAGTVTAWYPDPKVAGREVGWVQACHDYGYPTRQLAIRKLKRNGKWSYHVLVFNLSDATLFDLARQAQLPDPTSDQILWAALTAYDLRGGGVETAIKGSKQGLGLTKRNKQQFAAQEILVLLAQLAYNLISWFRRNAPPQLSAFGMVRMVRDVFHIPGQLELDAQGRLLQISLHAQHPFASPFIKALSSALAGRNLYRNLCQI